MKELVEFEGEVSKGNTPGIDDHYQQETTRLALCTVFVLRVLFYFPQEHDPRFANIWLRHRV